MYFNPEIHKCPCCDFTSGTEKNVKKHIDKVHDGKCYICKVKFKTTTRLKNHILSVHEKRKPYKCSSCHYRSSLKGNVRKHIAKAHEGTHSKEIYLGPKIHKCPCCDF